MAIEYIADRINNLFTAPDAVGSEDLRAILDRLYENLDQSAKVVNSQLYLLVAVWLGSVAIAYGLVSEGGVATLKFASVRSLLIAVPAIIGFQYYLIEAALSWHILLASAINQIYVNHNKKINSISALLEPPSFVNVETFTTEETASATQPYMKLNSAGFYLMAILLLFGGILIFFHVISLALLHSGLPHRWGILAAVIGAIPIVRGFVLFLTLAEMKHK